MKRIDSNGSTEALQFEGLSHPVTGHRWPPKGRTVEEMRTHPLNHSAQHAIAAVGTLDDHVALMKKSKEFSAEGIAKHTTDMRKTATQKVSDALNTAAATRKRNADARAKLFAVPPLEPGDAVNAHLDSEIRSRIHAMPMADQHKHANDPRVLHALIRDPIPSTVREVATAKWNSQVEKDNPDAVVKLDSEDEMADWLHSVASTLHGVLQKTDAPETTEQRTAAAMQTRSNGGVQPSAT